MDTQTAAIPELVEVVVDNRAQPRPVRVVGDLAESQDGVVGHEQLIGLGFSKGWIERKRAVGWLRVVFRGAYAVGHRRITWRGRLRAAILSCGPDAYISHRTAAALHGLRRSGSGLIHVTAPPGGREDRPGIVLHRVRNMRANEKSAVDGIPCTSPARTCLDMAAIASRDVLGQILEEAEKQAVLDITAFTAVCKRGRKGSAALKRALHLYQPVPGWTRSRLERRALRALRNAGITPQGINVWVADAAVEVDIAFYDRRLVIEVDGGFTHHTTAARLRDPQRDAKLQIAGYAVLRVPEYRLVHEPREFADDVGRLLSRGERTQGRPGR